MQGGDAPPHTKETKGTRRAKRADEFGGILFEYTGNRGNPAREARRGIPEVFCSKYEGKNTRNKGNLVREARREFLGLFHSNTKGIKVNPTREARQGDFKGIFVQNTKEIQGGTMEIRRAKRAGGFFGCFA